MTNSIEEVTTALLWAQGSDEKPLLTESQAFFRAQAIVEEMNYLAFPLKIIRWPNMETDHGWLPYPAYELPDQRYDLDSVGPGTKGQFGINGPGISCGDLLSLGRACEIKQQFLPKGWPKESKDQLRDPQSHLDAVEELLWLSRFQGVQNVQSKILQDGGKDVDWVFSSCTQPLQIEVKNRRRDAVGIIDGAHRGREYPSWYSDLIRKFSRKDDKFLNVACITTYFETDLALIERAQELLTVEPVDGVIFWSCHCPDGQHLQVYAKSPIRKLLLSLLAPIPREVSQKYLLLTHLLRNSDQQRVLTVDEIISQAADCYASE